MKKLLMFSAFGLIGFSSYKKEENNPKSITYSVECKEFTVYLNGGLLDQLKQILFHCQSP